MYISSRLIRFSGQSCQFHRAESDSYDFPRVCSCRRCHIFLLLSIGVSMLANQSANKTSGLLICLFCQSLDLNITRVSISIFSVSHLKSTQLTICSGTAFLICHSEVLLCFMIHAWMHTHTHSTLCHLLKTVGSGYGLSPPLCYHSPVPLLSVSQLGPLSCIWNPLSECMCEEYRVNVSSPRPYVIMKL